jgi:MFS family permease
MRGAALWAPLRVPDYRRLWLAQTVSIVGDKIDQIAMSIVIYRITESALQVGVMLAVTLLPSALFGFVAGPLVDRWPRRRTMIAADVARAVLVACIPFVAMLDVPAAWRVGGIYAVAFLVAVASLFFEPARMALVPEVVESGDLMAANSLDSSTTSIAELAGIGIGGALVAAIGYPAAFFIDAGTFLVSALVILRIKHRGPARESRSARAFSAFRAELADGVRHISGRPVLRELVGMNAAAAFGASAAVTLFFVLALSGFTASGLPDAVRLGVLEASVTAGLLVGGVLVGMAGPTRAGMKFLAGLATFGALLVFVGLMTDIWAAAAVLFVSGVANTWFHVPMITLLQRVTEDRFRGRVFALRTALVRVLAVLGLLGAGALAQRVGVAWAMGLVGVFVLAVGLVGFSRSALREA